MKPEKQIANKKEATRKVKELEKNVRKKHSLTSGLSERALAKRPDVVIKALRRRLRWCQCKMILFQLPLLLLVIPNYVFKFLHEACMGISDWWYGLTCQHRVFEFEINKLENRIARIRSDKNWPRSDEEREKWKKYGWPHEEGWRERMEADTE